MLPPAAASTRKLFKEPGLTVNELEVPVSVLPVLVAVIVLPDPAPVRVTDSVLTPAEKADVVVGLILPAVVVRSTVPVKLVTVLLLASLAVIVMLKAEPAVW